MKMIDARVRLRTPQLSQFWDAQVNKDIADYHNKYDLADRISVLPTSQLIMEAGAAGIGRLLVYGSSMAENREILKEAVTHGELIPVCGISMSAGIRQALLNIEELKAEGAVAIDLSFLEDLNANSKEYYAVFAYCERHEIPIIIHSGIHYAHGRSMWKAQPQYFDEIAVDFPDLRIILSHGGNGFGPAILAVVQRHANLYLEFSAMRPKYMAPEFIQAANTYLKDRCMFGTDYPLTTFAEQVDMWQYALREEVWPGFFGENLLTALSIK